MNIAQENIDKLNAVLSVKVDKTDYEARVDEVLKDYRKKARVDGFRPGNVPMGLIRKMYFTPVLVDEVNKLVSESLFFRQSPGNIFKRDRGRVGISNVKPVPAMRGDPVIIVEKLSKIIRSIGPPVSLALLARRFEVCGVV